MADKTIKQMADELGVSKQAIRKHINRLVPTQVSTGANRTILINPDGQAVLRALVSTQVSTQVSTSTNQVDTLITMLQAELEAKNEQLKEKDKQIEELNNRLAEAHKLLDQEQKIHVVAVAEQKPFIQELEKGEKEKPKQAPKGLFARWRQRREE